MKYNKIYWLAAIMLMILSTPSLASNLKYGDPFPLISGTDTYSNNKTTLNKGKWNLVYYVGRPLANYAKTIKYLGVLKSRLNSLSILVVSDQAIIKIFYDHKPPFSIIMDEKAQIKNILDIKESESAIFFIDPLGIIRFSNYDFVRSVDIRMLSEQFLLGNVTSFDNSNKNKLQIGDLIPSLLLKKVGEESKIKFVDLAGEYIILLWTADCTDCVLDQLRENLISWQKDTKHVATIHIFSSKFDEQSLIEMLKINNIEKGYYYIATSEIYGVEDLYYEKSYFDFPVVALYISSNSKIKRKESFAKILENGKINN
jgi:hypothetical protein